MVRLDRLGRTTERAWIYGATLAVSASLVVMSLGAGMIAAWLHGSVWLEDFYPHLFQLKCNTAVCFFLCGAGLLGAVQAKPPGWKYLSILVSSLALLLSGATLWEYIAGTRLGIDQWLVRDFHSPDIAYPGRMAPNTGVAFVCTAVTLLLHFAGSSEQSRDREWRISGEETLSALVLVLAAEGLVSSFQRFNGISFFSGYERMAVLTSFGFLILSVGLLALISSDSEVWKRRAPLWMPILACALVVTLDLHVPIGIAVGIGYIPLVFCGSWFSRPRSTFVLALIATLLAWSTFTLKALALDPLWTGVTNRALTTGTIWLTAVLVFRNRTNALALEEAAASSELLASIVASSDDAILALDLDGLILAWNRGAQSLLGYSASEIVGRRISILIPEPLRRDEEYIFGELRAGRSVNQFETVRRHKDGARIPVSLTVSRICNAGGKVIGSSAVIRDISARVKAETALKSSEQRHTLALHALSVGVWEWDMSTNEVRWSPTFRRLLGISDEDYQPCHLDFISRIHPEDKERAEEAMQAHLQSKAALDLEFRLCRNDRTYIWIRATGQATWDDDGTPIRIVGSIDDISDRKREEEKSRLIFESAPIAIVTIHCDGNIVVVNREAEKLFGYPQSAMVGKSIEMLIPMRYRHRHTAHRDGFMFGPDSSRSGSTNMSTRQDLYALRHDGSEFPVEVGLTRLTAGDEALVLTTVVDITPRKQLEEKTRRMNEILEQQVDERTSQLKAANLELDAFAYATAHDLKAPLRVIQNASVWLEEDLEPHLNAETRENMVLLRGRAQRMERLLDDLLEYSRIGRKTENRRAEPISGNMLLDDVLGLLNIPEGFTVDVDSSFAALEVNRMPLQQVLLNLISNAIKHHHKKTGLIELSVESLDACLLISVKDDGPGIPEQFHEQIFKMFQTLKPRDQVEGSGLGLAMVRKYVEISGGKISVESAVGQGSTFRFTWPKQQLTEKES